MMLIGERWVYWTDAEQAQAWEEFVGRGVGDLMEITTQDGDEFVAVVTRVDAEHRRVAFKKFAGEA